MRQNADLSWYDKDQKRWGLGWRGGVGRVGIWTNKLPTAIFPSQTRETQPTSSPASIYGPVGVTGPELNFSGNK